MSQTCHHLNRGNVPCGAPATHRNWTGKFWMPLCAECAQIVYRATRGKSNPTAMPGTVVQEKSVLPLPLGTAAAPVEPLARPAYKPAPTVFTSKPLSQLYREYQENQSEGSDLL